MPQAPTPSPALSLRAVAAELRAVSTALMVRMDKWDFKTLKCAQERYGDQAKIRMATGVEDPWGPASALPRAGDTGVARLNRSNNRQIDVAWDVRSDGTKPTLMLAAGGAEAFVFEAATTEAQA